MTRQQFAEPAVQTGCAHCGHTDFVLRDGRLRGLAPVKFCDACLAEFLVDGDTSLCAVCGIEKYCREQWRVRPANLRPNTPTEVRGRIEDAMRQRVRNEACLTLAFSEPGSSHSVQAIIETAGWINSCAACVELYAADANALEPAYPRSEPHPDPQVRLRSLPAPAAAMAEARHTTCRGCGRQRVGLMLFEGRDYGVAEGRFCLACLSKYGALTGAAAAQPATPVLAGSTNDVPDQPVRAGRLGRPRGSGTFRTREDFLATVVPIVRAITATEGYASQPRVAWYLTDSGQLSCDEGSIRYWVRHFGLTWKEVQAIAAGPT
jgi:hypothetical protein